MAAEREMQWVVLNLQGSAHNFSLTLNSAFILPRADFTPISEELVKNGCCEVLVSWGFQRNWPVRKNKIVVTLVSSSSLTQTISLGCENRQDQEELPQSCHLHAWKQDLSCSPEFSYLILTQRDEELLFRTRRNSIAEARHLFLCLPRISSTCAALFLVPLIFLLLLCFL